MKARNNPAALGVVFVVLGIALGGFAVASPVTADADQPAPAGEEWAGVPPQVSVECGTFFDSQVPVWPQGVRDDLDQAERRNGREACDAARGSRQLMLAGAGVLVAIGLAFGLFNTRLRAWGERRMSAKSIPT